MCNNKDMAFIVEVDENNVPFIRLNDHIVLRLDLEELDERFKEIARIELRQTPENVENGLKKLRELVEAERCLNIPCDDAFLIKFLRPCKYYPESAFKLLTRFYKFKREYPKVGIDLTPNHVRHVFVNEVFQFLPTRTESGSRIMVINAGHKWNPKVVELIDMFRCIMVSIEIAMLEPKTQVAGVHVIINLEGLSITHIYQFTPSLAKMIVDWVQECNSVRLKGIHIVNQSYLFNMGYAIFKPFLGDKLKKRIFIHGSNRKSLTEKVPANCLPLRFGGDGSVPEYPGQLLSEMLDYYQKDFALHNTYCYTKEPVK